MAQPRQPELDQALRDFIDWAPLSIVMVDGDGRIVLVNHETEDIFGHDREWLLGKPVEALVPVRLRKEHCRWREEYVRNPAAREMAAARDLHGLRSDGQEIPIEVRLKPIQTESGLYIFSAIVDITDRQRKERRARSVEVAARTAQLAEANQALSRSNFDLQQFAYIASHDLQEPLRKMASFSELLADKCAAQLDTDAQRYLHYIVDGATRMRTMIRDLLDFARLGQQPINPAPIKLDSVIEAAVLNLGMLINESGATVTTDPMPVVSVDADLLVSVFQNLIGNAIKYRRPEVPPRVHLSATTESNCCHITVSDNGIGIDPAYYDQIFMAFKRLHSHAQIPGTGLGLAVCKQIVERHGGTLSVAAGAEEGSVFSVHIPLEGASHEPANSGPATQNN